jgi:ribosomal protein S18 acetylase RimI-like enzyme
MQRTELSQLAIASAVDDADLEAIVAVRRRVNPDVHPRVDNLRHHLETNPTLTYLVGRLGGEPVGCGFVDSTPAPYAAAVIEVVPEQRRRGIGSAFLTEVSVRAAALGKDSLQLEVRESDPDSATFLERRGFARVGAERAVSLLLAGAEAEPPDPPPGIRIVSRAEEPGRLEELYAVAVEAERDIPGASGDRTFEAWRAEEIERPSRRPELFVLALSGDEIVGYAALHVFGNPKEGYHSLTGVKRSWRRRGVATALKRTVIAASAAEGLELLSTGSEERNTPMRRLNEKLGYRPDPARSTIVMRGPLG